MATGDLSDYYYDGTLGSGYTAGTGTSAVTYYGDTSSTAWNSGSYTVYGDSSTTNVYERWVIDYNREYEIHETFDGQQAVRTWQELGVPKPRDKAQERAEELLKSVLEPHELEEYERDKTISVPIGKRIYKITSLPAYNIKELDENGQQLRKLCVQVDEKVPVEDNMLAQLLFLKTRPEVVLATANVREL